MPRKTDRPIEVTKKLRSLRNMRIYHLRKLENPKLSEKEKEKHRNKISMILSEIAKLTHEDVDEIRNEYHRGKVGRPFKYIKMTEDSEQNCSEQNLSYMTTDLSDMTNEITPETKHNNEEKTKY